MASVGLNIHIDKENVTAQPGFGKGDILRFGSKNKGLPVHATPRKALYDVNTPKDMPNSTALKPASERGFLKPSVNKPQNKAPKLSVVSENQPSSRQTIKPDGKKKSQQEHKTTQKLSGSKATKSKKHEPKISEPTPEESDGYDSDTIWPRAERLSSHMHKLLSWRPPCLFGVTENSDSDKSFSEPELNISDLDLDCVPPVELPESEINLSGMLLGLPDPEQPPEFDFCNTTEADLPDPNVCDPAT